MNALCRHFGACGGCALQDLSTAAYRDFKQTLISDALSRHGLDPAALKGIVTVLPSSRRRAVFKVEKKAGDTRIGFHAQRSHDIIDMRECFVLTPRLFEAAQGLRAMMETILKDGEGAELYVLDADNGFDVAISWKRSIDPSLIATVAPFARKLNLVRVMAARDLLTQSTAPEVRLGKVRVHPPPNAFLQPTREGEIILQGLVLKAIGKQTRVADLFCGCGTFALPLAERSQVHAIDNSGPMLDALSAAAQATPGLKPIATEKRDLLRQPLEASGLNRFGAVVLDPPRAGAAAQSAQLAKSQVRRVAYVSCDTASFARDARVLVDGGFRLAEVMGVDQFVWSPHIELAATFARD